MAKHSKFLVIAFVAAWLLAGCNSGDSKASTTTTAPPSKGDTAVTDMDATQGVLTRPSPGTGKSVAVPVEAVRAVSDSTYLVTAFVAPCATVTSASVAPDGTATVTAEQVDCAKERILVAVEVEVKK